CTLHASGELLLTRPDGLRDGQSRDPRSRRQRRHHLRRAPVRHHGRSFVRRSRDLAPIIGAMHDENLRIGRAWMRAFNAHDVDALVALYADDATHTSPKIRALHPETGGKLVGKAALASWWREANARLPNLRYEETAITANASRVIVEYLRYAPNARGER